MGNLILVKHSLPEIDKDVPARDWHLTEKGRALARRLAEKLATYHPQIIFSSMEPKAWETAEIVSQGFGLEVHLLDGLHEHERSKSPFLSSEDDFRTTVHLFFERPNELVFGSETADQAYLRYSQAMKSILDLHTDKTIVVVSHGTVISLFTSRLTGISDYLLWKELRLPSYIVLDMESCKMIKKENIV